MEAAILMKFRNQVIIDFNFFQRKIQKTFVANGIVKITALLVKEIE